MSVVEMSLSAFFKAKGGFVRHHHEGEWIRFEFEIKGERLSFKTGASLRGFRVAEEEFGMVVPEGFGLDRTGSTALGVDLGYLGRNCPGETLIEKRLTFLKLKEKQAEQMDEDGFALPQVREPVKCTLQQYMTNLDENFDVIVCENEAHKRRVMQLFNGAAGGEWRGSEYWMPSVDTSEGIEKVNYRLLLRNIMKVWCDAEWITLKDICVKSAEHQVCGSVDERSRKAGDEISKLINKLRNDPLGPMREAEREKIFWGGGKPPISKRARERFIKDCFPPAKQKLSAPDFVGYIVDQAYKVWGLQEKMKEMEFPDPQALAIGQIIRAQGQILFTDQSRELEYVPRPEEWILSQRRSKEWQC